MQKVVLFWFRRDLRLHDNVGLHAALASGFPVVPVFVFDEPILSSLEDRDDKRVSFIYRSLQMLQEELVKTGSTLDVRFGKPAETFATLLNDYAVHAVYANHDYEPYARKRDEAICNLLRQQGVAFHTYKDQVVFEKSDVVKDDGNGYIV